MNPSTKITPAMARVLSRMKRGWTLHFFRDKAWLLSPNGAVISKVRIDVFERLRHVNMLQLLSVGQNDERWIMRSPNSGVN